MSEDDYEILSAKSKEVGWTVSSYIRFITTNTNVSKDTVISDNSSAPLSKEVVIRISDEELRVIRKKANELNVKVNLYARYVINKATIKVKFGD